MPNPTSAPVRSTSLGSTEGRKDGSICVCRLCLFTIADDDSGQPFINNLQTWCGVSDKTKGQKRTSRAESKTSHQKLHKCRRKVTKHDTLNPAYWEAKLKRMGLTMDAGANREFESGNGYSLRDLAYISDKRQSRGHNSRATVTGESLEHGEWPVSLC